MKQRSTVGLGFIGLLLSLAMSWPVHAQTTPTPTPTPSMGITASPIIEVIAPAAGQSIATVSGDNNAMIRFEMDLWLGGQQVAETVTYSPTNIRDVYTARVFLFREGPNNTLIKVTEFDLTPAIHSSGKRWVRRRDYPRSNLVDGKYVWIGRVTWPHLHGDTVKRFFTLSTVAPSG